MSWKSQYKVLKTWRNQCLLVHYYQNMCSHYGLEKIKTEQMPESNTHFRKHINTYIYIEKWKFQICFRHQISSMISSVLFYIASQTHSWWCFFFKFIISRITKSLNTYLKKNTVYSQKQSFYSVSLQSCCHILTVCVLYLRK